MNAISSAAQPPLSHRLILRLRLACGGAVAGLFAGSILAAVSGALLDDVAFGPLLLAIAGAIWGILLGISDDDL